MASLNKVFLMGNLTRDPELRVTPKGTPVCQFGLAINRQYKDEGGQTRDETTFVDIEAWGKAGETISKYLTKGRPLFIEGRLKLDTWDDKTTGQKRTKMRIVLESFQFLGGRDNDAGTQPGDPGDHAAAGRTQSGQQSQPGARPASRPPADVLDEDVPF